METAPVAIFVYNRPVHTERMLDSLLANNISKVTAITVYSDGPKNKADAKLIAQVRTAIKKKLPWATLITRDTNIGLADSVIHGVSEQCALHGKVIVLEDDLELSPCFLAYMNDALKYYENKTAVMHISGYSPPVDIQLEPTFFFREPSPWGWATWQRAWQYFETDASKLARKLYDSRQLQAFNQDHSYLFWEMLIRQIRGDIDSWAIRWYSSIFIQRGLSLYPGASLVQNHGFDGSGQHCEASDEYYVDLSLSVPVFTDAIKESQVFVEAMQRYRTRNWLQRIANSMKHFRALYQYQAGITRR